MDSVNLELESDNLSHYSQRRNLKLKLVYQRRKVLVQTRMVNQTMLQQMFLVRLWSWYNKQKH